MPNVDSNGKLGRSMDYSMYLKRKRHNVLTTGYTLKSEAGNPMFGRDQKTRGFDNGIVTVLFEKGLIVGSGSGTLGRTFTISYINSLDINFESVFLAAGFPADAYGYIQYYTEQLTQGNLILDPLILSNFQKLTPITLTTTNNTTGESYTYTLIGNPATDKSTFDNTPKLTPNIGDSMTVIITFG